MPESDDVKATTPRPKLTYDDFVLFPDDGKRHELIDGEHYVTPSPNIRHQQLSGRLYLLVADLITPKHVRGAPEIVVEIGCRPHCCRGS